MAVDTCPADNPFILGKGSCAVPVVIDYASLICQDCVMSQMEESPFL